MGMGRQKQVRASGINAYPISGYIRQPSPSHQMCAPKNIKQLNHQQYGNTYWLWGFNLGGTKLDRFFELDIQLLEFKISISV